MQAEPRFPDVLADARRGKDLSQQAVADKLGVSRQLVSLWEQGSRTPGYQHLLKLANLYEVSFPSLAELAAS
jgi:transcriptional regulator with XRE-family HTH domain